MTDFGRRLPFAGVAIAIDCVTATKGRSRPEAVIQVSCRERPLPDRKADIGDVIYEKWATLAWLKCLKLKG